MDININDLVVLIKKDPTLLKSLHSVLLPNVDLIKPLIKDVVYEIKDKDDINIAHAYNLNISFSHFVVSKYNTKSILEMFEHLSESEQDLFRSSKILSFPLLEDAQSIEMLKKIIEYKLRTEEYDFNYVYFDAKNKFFINYYLLPYIKKINIQIHKNILFQKTSNISDIINLFSLLNTKNEHLLINTLLNGSIMCVSENQQLKCLFHKLIKKKPSLLIQHNKLKVLIYELGLPSTLTPDIHFLNACIHLPINESKKMITFHKDKIENKEEFMFENKLYSPGRLSLLKELDVELYKKVKHVMSNTKLLGLKNKDFINLLKTHLLNQAPNIQDINFEY